MSNLSLKSCMPTDETIKPLQSKELTNLLSSLKNKWLINKPGYLYFEYKFKNFIEAIKFVNKVACIAEQESHHPDLLISSTKCGVRILTHKINQLTENDFILAAKIDEIYEY